MKTLSKKGKRLLIISCLFYAFESVLIAFQTYINSLIISYAEAGDWKKTMNSFMIALGFFLFGYFISAMAIYTRLVFLAEGELVMKNEIMKSIFCRPIKTFLEKDDAYYLNLLTTDTDMYRVDYLNSMPFMFSSLASIIVSIVMLFRIHPLFLVTAFIMAGIPLFITKPFTSIEQKKREIYSQMSEEYTQILKETIEGYETIRICSNDSSFQGRYSESAKKMQQARTNYIFANNISNETFMSIAGLSSIICFGVGSFFVMNGNINIGILFAVVNYFSALSNGFSNVMEYIVTIRSTKKTVEKLQKQRCVSYSKKEDGLYIHDMDIEYNHLSFGFKDRYIYKNFTMKFKKNGCYAILGESGSGKTTLIKLLLKYYDNYEGEILLGGRDIRDMSEEDIYAKVGVVTQTPIMFNASLYENITMFNGQPKQDSEEYISLLKELKLTTLSERVKEQPLGDFGDKISGGEKQRIHIARTMCRKPCVLFFDEPTTGLDPENVALVNDFIFSSQNITRIVITHNWHKEYLDRFDGVINITNNN